MPSVFNTRLNSISIPRLFEHFQEDAVYRPANGEALRDIKVVVIGSLGGSGGPSRRRENEQYHQTETAAVDLFVYEHSDDNPGITKAKMGDVIVFRNANWVFDEELSKDGDVFTLRFKSKNVLSAGRVEVGL